MNATHQKPPCVFCGYNGSNYWSRFTHSEKCPFYNIGGMLERLQIVTDLTIKLWHAFTSAEEYINKSPCCPDITDEQQQAFADYQDKSSDIYELIK